jgi:hypothetical protein
MVPLQPSPRLSVYFGSEVNCSFGSTTLVWQQWRTMASRSMEIRKIDGLLVAAVELCAIVRASCLSPSLPFFLCFGLWQYLWRALPRWKETASTARLPSIVRLVRAAAFAATLMLPSEGWAQDPVARAVATLPALSASAPFLPVLRSTRPCPLRVAHSPGDTARPLPEQSDLHR